LYFVGEREKKRKRLWEKRASLASRRPRAYAAGAREQCHHHFFGHIKPGSRVPLRFLSLLHNSPPPLFHTSLPSSSPSIQQTPTDYPNKHHVRRNYCAYRAFISLTFYAAPIIPIANQRIPDLFIHSFIPVPSITSLSLSLSTSTSPYARTHNE
jgi:hypothetical protein